MSPPPLVFLAVVVGDVVVDVAVDQLFPWLPGLPDHGVPLADAQVNGVSANQPSKTTSIHASGRAAGARVGHVVLSSAALTYAVGFCSRARLQPGAQK
jgi:hypothetical protein